MIDVAELPDNRQALRDACDEVGIAYTKSHSKAQLRDLIVEYNATQAPAPGLPGGEPISEQANGFLVVKVEDGSGGLQVQVAPIGDATLLEAPAVLAAGLREVKAQFGL